MVCTDLPEALRFDETPLWCVITRQHKGQVTVFTSDMDDLEKLVPDAIVVKKV
ncbi:hypothetical protein [Streptomyces sp. NBC_00005]|uniref:hypothetical protein n=1 Tax=Streptomyces sp. NBC_00005 TaxID=2903609 RepID=UPI00324DD14B